MCVARVVANCAHTSPPLCADLLKVHDEAVQAMRYPDRLSAADDQLERERAQREERELVASIEDGKEDEE